MPIMSLSMPDQTVPWNRVLPKPTALLHDYFNDPFSRRDSSLLQHHVTSDRISGAVSDDSASRRLTVPSIAYSEAPRSPVRPSVSDSKTSVSTLRIDEGAIARKRTASLMEDDLPSRDPSPMIEDQAEDSPNQFCLCQPDPKIPRPRNAFILYRQHHQAAVVAQHPGLPNPEISKVLGRQWSSLTAQHKKKWQALAEEEKARHQQQYPDYRYQPRRNNRSGHSSANSVPETTVTASTSPSNCSKCGGKIMHPPMTPATAHSPTTPGMQPPTAGIAPAPRRGYAINGVPQNVRAVGPLIPSPPQGRIRPFGEVFGNDSRVRYGPMPPTPMTPDPKRRRFNGNGLYIAGRPEIGESTYTNSPRRISLPRPEAAHQQRAVIGPAPDRSVYRQQRGPTAQVSPPAKHDPSLTLAPLKTSGASQTQKGGVKAMILSIPVLNKIKILAQAAPQLATPGPASPPHEVRGAILAVEGLDAAKVKVMTQYLAEELSKSDKFNVKTFSGPEVLLAEVDAEVAPQGPETFLQTIGCWHKVSRDMCKFITTTLSDVSASTPLNTLASPVATQPPKPGNGTESESEDSKDTEMANTTIDTPERDPISAVSPRTIIPSTAALSIVPSKAAAISEPTESKLIFPVAIVSRYQLTTVDSSAISMSITDSYSPLDHWRWLAALWRGCVGPDVTIVVQGPDEGEKVSGENWDMGGTCVNVRLQDARTVVVRMGKEGELDEKALRRVGFEVEEFLRR